MSCFWNSLYIFFINKIKRSKDIIDYLKNNNKKAKVIVNGTLINEKLIEENFSAIKELKNEYYESGYYTSMCDPVLCLITDLFDIHIIHEWNLEKN